MKKILLTSLLLTSTLLVSCGNKTNSVDEEGNTIIKMSIMNSTNENPGWLAMIDAANEVLKANNEKVRIEPDIIKTDSWDQYYTKVATNMIGHIGGTIGRIAESHVPMMIEKNQLQDLTEICNDLISLKDYEETINSLQKTETDYFEEMCSLVGHDSKTTLVPASAASFDENFQIIMNAYCLEYEQKLKEKIKVILSKNKKENYKRGKKTNY